MSNRVHTTCRGLLVGVMLAIPLRAEETIFPAQRFDRDRLQRLYADQCLDALEGRDWLFSDAQSVEALATRARERELPLTLVPIASRSSTSETWRAAVDALGSARLSAAAELGPVTFVRAWLKADPQEAARRLATMVLPDLWEDAGLTAVPNGVLFLGSPDVDTVLETLDERLEHHRHLWDVVAEELILPASGRPALAEAQLRVRRQVAWVANNLGVLLQDADRMTEAMEVFTRARALDPQNVSALLNRAVCVKRGIRPELAQQVGRELEGLRENLPDVRVLWSLTQIYGKVAVPEEFVPLGWVWALSGLQASDPDRWRPALASVPEEHQETVRRHLHASHMGQSGATDGDLALLDALEDETRRGEALVALARRISAQGRTENAGRWLERAAEAGIAAERLAVERAAVLLTEGNAEEARTLLEKEVAEHPEAQAPWTLLLKLYADAGEQEALEQAIAQLAQSSDETLAFEVRIAEARLLSLQGRHGQARDLLLQAVSDRPDSAILYDLLLPLDFRMADKRSAATHADALLKFHPDHAFANYIKGTLLLERKDYVAAEPFFRRSLSAAVTLHALNDFATLLLETRRPEEAERAARSAIRLNDQLAAPWDTLASALEALNREDEAFAAMERAVAGNGADDPRIQFHWAKMLHQRGSIEQAWTAAEKAHARRLELDARGREELLRLRDALERNAKP